MVRPTMALWSTRWRNQAARHLRRLSRRLAHRSQIRLARHDTSPTSRRYNLMANKLIIEPKTVMGLSVGDLVRCDDPQHGYSIKPSRIAHIRDPIRWSNTRMMGIIWPYPVFSMIVGPEEWQIDQPLRESQMGYINNIHRTADGQHIEQLRMDTHHRRTSHRNPNAGQSLRPTH